MLTKQKALFAREYMKDQNATKAAIRAGYSEKTARSQGCRLLTDVDIQRELADWKKEIAALADVSKEELVAMLGEVTRARITDFMDEETGRLKVTKDSPNLAAVQEYYEEEDETPVGTRTRRKIKLRDPVMAAVRIGEFLNLKEASPEDASAPQKLVIEIVDGKGRMQE